MGYRKVTSDTPDFRIVYRVTAEEKSRIDGSYGYGSYGYYGYGSHGYGSYGYGGPYVYPRSSYRGSFGFSLYGGRYLRPFYGYPGAGYGGTGRVCQRPSKAAQVWPSKIAHLAEVTSL